jgi:secreted PhoX family phosphatase
MAQSEHGADAGFCGPGISPDERMLFVNVQGPGTAFVVQGPFRRLT